MGTYPPVLTPLGAQQLLDGIDAHLFFTSADGNSRFRLDGPLSPLAPGVPGQDGLILTGHMGLLTGSGFKHLDLQAATQDGVTNTDTVYEPGKITLKLEAHGRTPQAIEAVRREWQGAWSPYQLHTLEYITLDGGYWTTKVRLDQTWADTIKLNPRRQLCMPITHVCRIDDAFWTSMPSLSTFGLKFQTIADDFSAPNPSGLSGSWTQHYSPGHTGICYASEGGTAQWWDNGDSSQSVINLHNTPLDTDYQVASITLSSQAWLLAPPGDPAEDSPTRQQNTMGFTIGTIGGGKAIEYIYLRSDSTGANCIRLAFTNAVMWVSRMVDGVESLMWLQPLIIPPLRGEKWTLVAGANLNSPRTYAVKRGELQITPTFSEIGSDSRLGADYRQTGFGMYAAGGILGFRERFPMAVEGFAAADQTQDTQSGNLTLSNIGTQPGYPELLVYGPGTIGFGDGPGSSNMVTFGPLNDGQIALITTLSRLRGVVDLTPGSPATNVTPNQLQQLENLVFNGNTPPLLNWIQSQFGVIPSQTTNLYSLLNGRYKTPLPYVSIPSLAKPQTIPVSITNGTLSSKIVGRLVPQRIAP